MSLLNQLNTQTDLIIITRYEGNIVAYEYEMHPTMGMCDLEVNPDLQIPESVKNAFLDWESKQKPYQFNDFYISVKDIEKGIGELGYRADGGVVEYSLV